MTEHTLDDLLAEFDAATAAQQPPPQPMPDVEEARQRLDAIAALRASHDAEVARLRAKEEQLEQREREREAEHRESLQTRADVERAFASIRNLNTGNDSPDKATADRAYVKRIMSMSDQEYERHKREELGPSSGTYFGWS
jgi:hypothetical protein